jgi:hypothetical protein
LGHKAVCFCFRAAKTAEAIQRIAKKDNHGDSLMIIDFTAEEITDMIWALRMFAEIKQPASMVERMRILELK